MSIRRALTRNRARTHADHADPRLRGRAYLLPFGQVWTATLALARELPLWTVTAADPQQGRIRAEARTRVWKFVDDVEIVVSLDELGRTRVDLESASRVGRMDLGTNARRIARFLRRLDARLLPRPR